MKHPLYILFIILFAACNETKVVNDKDLAPEDSKKTTVKLLDSLGFITCSVPNRYDTLFQWTNEGDCGKSCDHEEYRFQLKSNPISKESGWFYEYPKDSIDQFTIRHNNYFPFHSSTDTSKKRISTHGFHFKGRLSYDLNNPPVIFDTIEKINDRYFSIIIMDTLSEVNHLHYTKVAGLTTIRGNEIEFYYDLKTKDTSVKTSEFIDNSLRLMRTIRLSNGL